MADEPRDGQARLAHFVEAADRPLLVLAVFTVVLYLLELRGIFGEGDALRALHVFNVAVDLLFTVDVALKFAAFRGRYVRSPWFLVDCLSCLPVVSALARLPYLGAIRFVRFFRVLRILRTLRVLRALQSIPALDRFFKESRESPAAHRFAVAMNIGVLAYSLVFLGTIHGIRSSEEAEFVARSSTELANPLTGAALARLGGHLQAGLPDHDGHMGEISRELEARATVDGQPRTVYLSFEPVEKRAAEIEFFLVLGAMVAIGMFVYIMHYQLQDISSGQLRALLNIALPRQVAEHFFHNPDSYQEKHRMPATIVFMDFVGFTRTSEQLGSDVQTLSTHLERAMDCVVDELVKHDLIIDKFIGDSIMSFRGGPLVTGTKEEHAARVVRGSLAGNRALRKLNDPYFSQLKIGGASTPDCLIGAFGTSSRLSYTVLGDGVNLAARLEPACGQCETSTLFCDLTRTLCGKADGIAWRKWGRIRVKGKLHPITVHEALEPQAVGPWVGAYELGIEAYERQDFAAARGHFQIADELRPGGDAPSKLHLAMLQTLAPEALPAGWEPVLATHK